MSDDAIDKFRNDCADAVAERLRDAIADRDHITRNDIPRYIRALLNAGWSEARIVRATGIARNTVRNHNPELP